MQRRTRRAAAVPREKELLAEADRLVEENRGKVQRRTAIASRVASKKGAARLTKQRRLLAAEPPPDDAEEVRRAPSAPAPDLTVSTKLQPRHYHWLLARAQQKGIPVEREIEYLIRQAYQQDATKAGLRGGGGSGKRDEFNPVAGNWTK